MRVAMHTPRGQSQKTETLVSISIKRPQYNNEIGQTAYDKVCMR